MEWEDVKQKLNDSAAVDQAINAVRGAFYEESTRLEEYGFTQTIKALEKMRDGDDRDLSDVDKGLVTAFMSDDFQEVVAKRARYEDFQDSPAFDALGTSREANDRAMEVLEISPELVSDFVKLQSMDYFSRLQQAAEQTPEVLEQQDKLLLSGLEKLNEESELNEAEKVAFTTFFDQSAALGILNIAINGSYQDFGVVAEQEIKAAIFEKVELLEMTTGEFVDVLDQSHSGKTADLKANIADLENKIVSAAHKHGWDNIPFELEGELAYWNERKREVDVPDRLAKQSLESASGDDKRLVTEAVLMASELTTEQLETLSFLAFTDVQADEAYVEKVTYGDISALATQEGLNLSEYGKVLIEKANQRDPATKDQAIGFSGDKGIIEHIGVDDNQWNFLKERIRDRDDLAEAKQYGNALKLDENALDLKKEDIPKADEVEKGGRQK